MMGLIEQLKGEWEDFWYKYSDERIELARHRLRVHRLNLKGECPVNPYTEPDSNWYQH
jgi:hypothetical protein